MSDLKQPNPVVTFPKDEFGPEMKGAEALVWALEKVGVEVLFAYPGGASIELHQALTRSEKIRTILPRFEQGGGFMAHGYARSTGRVGVCMATSGPGATNLVTCIADAFMDSIPLVAITGQVYSKFIGKAAFQETDVFGITLPIVKHSYLLLDPNDIARTVREAFHIAGSGRPGPVLIDVPKDVQQARVKPVFPVSIDLPGYSTGLHGQEAGDDTLLPVLDLVANARKPVLYTGGGIISAGAEKELREFAEATGIPVATTLMGLGAFPEDHALSLRWFGMHGTVAGNWAVCESDLLICAGARFDDRITGVVEKFAPDATIVHIDLDISEHNKNKRVDYPIHSDVRYALRRMAELALTSGFQKPDLSAWLERIAEWKEQYPFRYEPSEHILQQEAIEVLYEESDGQALIATGVGQHQMWAAQYYQFKQPRAYISSLGLGTMGFGLPAAIGAKLANPDKTVVDIDGDGSFMMNLQELATAAVEKIPVKVLLLDNQHLGMVVQWEDRFYEGTRGHTVLGHKDNIGSPVNADGLYPDWVRICEGFGVKARRVIQRSELRDGIREMLDHDGPYVLHVVVPYTEHVLPMIPQGRGAKEMLIE